MLISILFFCLNNVVTTGKKTEVIWMVPSWSCTGNHSIPVEKYGIIQNENQHYYKGGSKFAIFYMEKFGKIPYFEDFEEPINGGLPQNGNFSEHLRVAEEDIVKYIPSKDFDGLAVIDLENFRPNWEQSWSSFNIYKTESLKRARQNNPTASKEEITLIAREEYDSAAKKYFLETIRLGKRLRPKAKWGYYLFPKCNFNVDKTNNKCSDKMKVYNDNMDWLWKESQALFPSYYLSKKGEERHDIDKLNFAALISETQRVKKVYCPECEIHMFTGFEYDPYKNASYMYTKASLRISLEYIMRHNLDGAVIWSTSKNMKQRCDNITTYVNDYLGPHVQYINQDLDKCRKKICRGRGECYLPHGVVNPNSSDYLCRYDQ
ncbi:unnamed protein product [Caenorhabditis angaria]|uniref:Hyaluronidase n=1 Tax=Caenorhabditis angaria TaxID=860376 RepID=A0A9P1MYA4_9PELO|nr:unnamed protein product [Caenorhabditis angaria]